MASKFIPLNFVKLNLFKANDYLNAYNRIMRGLLYLGYENSLLVMLTLGLTGENKICNVALNSVVGKEKTAEITSTF